MAEGQTFQWKCPDCNQIAGRHLSGCFYSDVKPDPANAYKLIRQSKDGFLIFDLRYPGMCRIDLALITNGAIK